MCVETFEILGPGNFNKAKGLSLLGGKIVKVESGKGCTKVVVEHDHNLAGVRSELGDIFSPGKVVYSASRAVKS